ncbi:hypothetical protein [Nostoc sp. FACHB-145]|uniref:hypothetical protein n=1 Tax=Nostoc sp. FACHB-145 TaxID=2692836 RepID=UPI0016836942|nr:hypothetical protein [Nostoc sp. FACHB-145]MBD2468768.1 hypothetical protein [Nostoc sp. FACHB-145]
MEQVLELFKTKHYWFFQRSCAYLLAMFIVGYLLPTTALEQKANQADELGLLQTNVTQSDVKIIEQLVTIAEQNSSEVLEAKSATGWRAFEDVVSIELSPSLTTTNYNSPIESEEKESSLYLSITLDPIKLISAFKRKPILQARLHEAKQQKRLAVIRYYLAYLQAHQAVKIATYRMQNFTNNKRIASLNAQTNSPENLQSLANADYVAAATEMLNSNAREQIALEELAACVGLYTSAMMAVMNRH